MCDKQALLRARGPRRESEFGFTLVEVMISAALGAVILAAVLSSFIAITRNSTLLYNYTGMEEEARRGLETFAEDVRMASGITWTSTTDVSVTVPHSTDSYTNTIRYWWDNTSGSSTYHCFKRTKTTRNSSGTVTSTTTLTIIRNVQSFQFNRWESGANSGIAAHGDSDTDQLQIHMTLSVQANQFGKVSTAVVAATNLVVSARYILRNKIGT